MRISGKGEIDHGEESEGRARGGVGRAADEALQHVGRVGDGAERVPNLVREASRELAEHGIHEFMNIKTVYVAG